MESLEIQKLIDKAIELDLESGLESYSPENLAGIQVDGKIAPTWFRGLGRAKQKLLKKCSFADKILATTSLAEMASNERVARWRFRNIQNEVDGHNLNFPTSGAGCDLWVALELLKSQRDLSIRVSDIDPINLELCRHNMKLFMNQFREFQFTCESFESLKDLEESWVFVDPSRRKEGQRFISSPTLESCSQLLDQAPVACIKAAPGEDVDYLKQQFPNWGIEVIEYRSEIKEITLKKSMSSKSLTAVRLYEDRDESFEGDSDEEIKLELSSVSEGSFVYLPCSALTRSGLHLSWAKKFDLQSYQGHPHLMVHSEDRTIGLCDKYRVLKVGAAKLPEAKNWLKEFPSSELRCLGVKPDPSWLRLVQAKGKSGIKKRCTLLLTRVQRSKKMLLLEKLD